MKRDIEHEITVDAPPSAVWAVLVETGAYPDWNPFVHRLEGDLREGSKLVVEIAPPGGKAMRFKPTVLAADEARELRWVGHLLVPGVFDGEHRFRLEALPGGRTRLTQSERFSGVLVGLLGGTLAKTQLGFEQMNIALKARAETRNA